MGSVVRRMAATLVVAMLLCSTPGWSQLEGIVGDFRELEAREHAIDAYVFGYPLVTMEMTRRVMTNVVAPQGARAPMVADIVEENEVATGRRSEGVFVAANSFVQKAASGIGIFGSSLLLGAIGFPRGAEPGQVAPEVIHRLGVVFAPTIVVLNLIALAFLSTYGISRASHEANLRRLDRA